MFSTRAIATAVVAITLAPVSARADTLIIPFFGVNFGGDSGKKFSDAFETNQFNWGGSLTFMGGGVFGIEGDLGYSPDFFGKTDAGGSSVLTMTGNLMIGLPFGGQQGFGFRPYGLGGVGLLKSSSDFGTGVAEIDENDVTWSAGGGVHPVLWDPDRFPFRHALLPDVQRPGDCRHPGRRLARKGRFHENLPWFRDEVLTLTPRMESGTVRMTNKVVSRVPDFWMNYGKRGPSRADHRAAARARRRSERARVDLEASGPGTTTRRRVTRTRRDRALAG